MKRTLLLILAVAALASARSFRTTKSGLWNDSTVWASTVPYPNADADTVTIAATHSCTLNVDLSGLATGFGKLADSGTLFMASGSGLKMANNIIGSGRFRCGDSVTSVDTVSLIFNGNYGSQITDWQCFGKPRDSILSYLVGGYAVGATKLKLDRNMWLRVGDVVAIACSTVVGKVTAEAANPHGATMYEVTAWDAVGCTMTITPALVVARKGGDFVSLITRAIKVWQVTNSSSNPVPNGNKNNQRFRGVWLKNWYNGFSGTSDSFISCSASNVTNGGVGRECYSCTFTSCSGANVTNGGVGSACYSCTFTSCSASNVTSGGVGYSCYSCTFTSCSGANVANGGVGYICYSCTFTSCSGANVAHGGVGYACYACTFTSCSGANVANGGVGRECYYCTFTSCSASNVTYGGVGRDCFSCTFTSCSHNSTYALYAGTDNRCSGSWSAKGVSPRDASYKYPPWHQTIWLDYDAAGRHRVYAYAGVETTATDKSAVIFSLEDATLPLILDFPLTARATVFNYTQRVQKSASMATLPRIMFFDATADTLITGAAPLAEDLMTNSIATDETLSVSVSGLTVGKRYVLRLLAQNASGTVTWYGADIANSQAQMTCAGQGDWFKLFP